MQYRNDIQVIRGLAVVMVVLFHLSLTGFENGFLGVDMFFVISGFLMALLYKPGQIGAFYKRRAARLLPAYFAALIGIVAVSAFVTLPSEHAQVVEQGITSATLVPNIGFWMQNSYFSKAEFTPMLHFWSLGVEFQFYAIVPLLFWLHRKSRFILPLLLAGTLAATFAAVLISPKTAFFIMPFRIWQFLIGAAAAHYLTDGGALRVRRSGLGTLSLVLMVFAIFIMPIDGSATSIVWGHPGVGALLVVLATFGLLVCGMPAWLDSGYIGKVFGKLGDWSYSIYLAHFPVIVFVLYEPFSGTILAPETPMQFVWIVALIVLSSAILYRLFDSQRRWSGNVAGAVAMIIAGVVVSYTSTQMSRAGYSKEELLVFDANNDRSVYRCGKIARLVDPTATTCVIDRGLADDAPALFLVGDSHSDSIKSTLADVAAERGYRLFITVSNSPILGPPRGEELLKIARQIDAEGIVMHYAQENFEKVRESGFAQQANGEFPLVWLAPVPRYKTNVPRLIWEDMQARRPIEQVPANLSGIVSAQSALEADGIPGFDMRPALCADKCLLVDEQKRPLYFDAHHLTLTGASRAKPIFNAALDELEAQRSDTRD